MIVIKAVDNNEQEGLWNAETHLKGPEEMRIEVGFAADLRCWFALIFVREKQPNSIGCAKMKSLH